jgi:hypothetical protein
VNFIGSKKTEIHHRQTSGRIEEVSERSSQPYPSKPDDKNDDILEK